MKRLLVIITLFAALLLSAYDVMLIPTLTVNVADQLQHVPLNRGLFVPSVYSVERGQPFSLYFFIGLKEAAVQDTELAGTLMLKDPAGKKKKLFKDIVLFKLTGKSSGVIAAESRGDAVFEPSDKSGDYEYTLILRDSAGKEKVVKAVVTLADTLIDSTPMDSEKMSDFLHNYYRRPQPGRVFAAWHFYLTSGAKLQQEKEGGRFNPSAVLLSFCEIFKLNPQYHDKLAAMSSSAPVDCHAYYAFVFAGLGKEFLEKYRKVIHPEIMILTDRLNGEDPFAFTAITEPFHADMAWARFFATGEFDVIKMLADILSQRPTMSIDEVKKKQAEGKSLTPEEKVRFRNFILQVAVMISFQSNIQRDHTLVRFYLENILEKKLFTDRQEAGLIANLLKSKSNKGNNK